MGDSIFAFIDPVSAVYNGGQAGYAHTKKITQSIITLNLLLCDGHILLLWINIICTKKLASYCMLTMARSVCCVSLFLKSPSL